MQTIQLDISDDKLDTFLTIVGNLQKDIVQGMRLKESHDFIDLQSMKNLNTSPEILKNNDIFSETAGLLSSQKIDPIAWQKQIRNEWD